MKTLYAKLAFTGIIKNRKNYVPYIFASSVMVMVFYLVVFLANNEMLSKVVGGDSMKDILSVGIPVMAIFSAIFLFYTNSFLVKRRRKEFGLYNLLGLSKAKIARVLLWENLAVYLLVLGLGLGLGILFSKLAEMLAARMLGGLPEYEFSVDLPAVILTAAVFALIFVLILLNSLRNLFFSRPIKLLQSESAGEKPPKTNIPFAVLGTLLLGAAYTMAIVIKEPMLALVGFMFAVIMVIIATYLLFIAGSVVLCRILRKNKRYYYKTAHFVSVSQMAFRMRRNGAGLASICILSTMVLVTISSTTVLYAGADDMIDATYPRECEVYFLEYTNNGNYDFDGDKYIPEINKLLEENGLPHENEIITHDMHLGARMLANGINSGLSEDTYFEGDFFIAGECEELVNRGITLGENEIVIAEKNTSNFKDFKTLTIEGVEYKVVSYINDIFSLPPTVNIVTNGSDEVMLLEIYVNSTETLLDIAKRAYERDEYGCDIYTHYLFDIGNDRFNEQLFYKAYNQAEELRTSLYNDDVNVTIDFRSEAEEGYLGIYGGLFFLGILLGGSFLTAAVLIMYYKQISEGYEDAARFNILQKVGMTAREIKSAVNSQVLTVFFLPLAAAGVHMIFAFPILSRIMRMFLTASTVWTFAGVTLLSYVVFSVIYMIVYKLTSSSYRRIVGKKL